MTTGLGYTYMDLYDNFKGHWHQIDASFDYALSKRIDVYALAVYQKASGSNNGRGESGVDRFFVVELLRHLGSGARTTSSRSVWGCATSSKLGRRSRNEPGRIERPGFLASCV